MVFRRYIRGIEQIAFQLLELNPFWEILQEFCDLPPRVGYTFFTYTLSMVGYILNIK